MRSLLLFCQIIWYSVVVMSSPRLATHKDFKHKGYFLNQMLFGEEPENNIAYLNEILIVDHESWWLQEPLERYITIPIPVYISDTSDLIETVHKHRVWEAADKDTKEFAKKNSYFIENALSSFSNEERLNKPYLCRQDGKLTPYKFTVLGDSHASIFEVASHRVKHMNATSVVSASMYGLKNISSSSGATRIFRDVLNERRHIGSEEDGDHVLVFNLGDVDIHGLSWRKYLYNETEGIERSLRVFGDFLKEHVELPGGYDKVVLVLAPPPTIKNPVFAAGQFNRSFIASNYEDRIKNINKFNKALKLFCSLRSYCSVLDIFPKVWGPNGVFRPYVNPVKPDTHLQAQRTFGVMLEQLRITLDAKWCIDDIDDDISSRKAQHDSDVSDLSLNNDPIGFEPVLVNFSIGIDDIACNFIVNAAHYLTPHELALQVAAGRYIEYEGDQNYLDRFLQFLNQSPESLMVVEKTLTVFLGIGWGEVYRPLAVEDIEEVGYLSVAQMTPQEGIEMPRLATHEDFKHKGYFLNHMLHGKQPRDDSMFINEVEIIDHESWWVNEPSKRYLASPIPVYISDTSELMEIVYKHSNWKCSDETSKEFARRGSYFVENALSSYSSKQRSNKPYLCRQEQDGKLTPYKFTVLGDSHASIFEVASHRVKHMNATSVVSASMYGLKNINSFSGHTRLFRDVLNERREFKSGTKDGTEHVLVFNLGDVDIHGYSWTKYLYNETEGIERSLRVFGDFLKEHVEVPGGYDKVVLVLAPPPTYKNNTQAHLHEIRIDYYAEYEDRIKCIDKFNIALKSFCSMRSYCSVLDIFPKVWGPNGVFRPYMNWVKPDIHLQPQRTFGVMLEQLRTTLDAKWCIDGNGSEGYRHDFDGSDLSTNIDPIGFEPVLVNFSIGIDDIACNFVVNAAHYLTPHELAIQVAAGRYIEYEGDQNYLDRFLQFLNQSPESLMVVEKTLTAFLGIGWGEIYRPSVVEETKEVSYLSVPRLATHEDFKHRGYFSNHLLYNQLENTSQNKSDYVNEFDITDHEVWWLEEPLHRHLVLPMPVYVYDTSKLLEVIKMQRNGKLCTNNDVQCMMKLRNEGSFVIENVVSSYASDARLNKPYLCNQDTRDKGKLLPYKFTVLGDSNTGIFDIAALRVKNMNVSTVRAASMYGLKNISSFSGATRIFRDVINERRRKFGSQEEGDHVLVFNLGDVDINGLSWRKYLYNETEGVERSLRAFGDFLKEHVEVPGGYDKVVLVLPPPATIKNMTTSRNHKGRLHQSEDLSYEDIVKSFDKFNKALRSFCSERSYCSILDIFPSIWGPNGVFRPYVSWVQPDTHLQPQRTFGLMLEQLRSTLDAKWCIDDDISSRKAQHDFDGSDLSTNIDPIGFEPVLLILIFNVDYPCNFVVNAVRHLTAHQLASEVITGKYIEFDGDKAQLDKLLDFFNRSPEGFMVLEKTLGDFLGEGWGEVYRPLVVEASEEVHYFLSVPKDVINTPRLAKHEDFKHKGYFLNHMVYDQLENISQNKSDYLNEFDITDHEVWWLEEPLTRHIALPMPIYIYDTPQLLGTIKMQKNGKLCGNNNVQCIMELQREGAPVIEKVVSSYTNEARLNKPYLCNQDSHDKGKLVPYKFTVLGDSHTGIFDIAALRVKNMNVSNIHAASMYGLSNISSSSGATRIFRDVINERRKFGSGEDGGEHVLVFSLGDVDIHGLSWRKYLYNETEGAERSLRVFGDFLKEHVEVPGGYDKVILVLAPPATIKNLSTSRSHKGRLHQSEDLSYEDVVKSIDKFSKALRLFCSEISYCSILDIFPSVWGPNGVFRPYVSWVQPDTHLQPQRTFGLMLEQLRSTLDAKWCIDDIDDNISSRKAQHDFDGSDLSTSNDPIGFEPVLLQLIFDVGGYPCIFIVNAVRHLTAQQLASEVITGKYIEFDGDKGQLDKLLDFLNRSPEGFMVLEKTLSKFLGEGWGEAYRPLVAEEADKATKEVDDLSVPQDFIKTSRLATHEDFKHKGYFLNNIVQGGMNKSLIPHNKSGFKIEIEVPDHERWWLEDPSERCLSFPVPFYRGDTPAFMELMFKHRKWQGTDEEAKIFAVKSASIIKSVLSFNSSEQESERPFLCKEQNMHGNNMLIPYKFTVLGDSHASIFEVASHRVKHMNATSAVSASMYGLKNISSSSGATRLFRDLINERRHIGSEEDGEHILVFNLGDVDVNGLGWRKYLYNQTEGVERSLRVFGDFLKEYVEVPGGYDRVVLVLPPPPVYKNQSAGNSYDIRSYHTGSYQDRIKSVAKFSEALELFCSQRSYCSILDVFGKVRGPDENVFRPYVNWIQPDIHLIPQRMFGIILEQLRSTLDAKWCIDGIDDDISSRKAQHDSGGSDLSLNIAANDPMGFEPVLVVIPFRISEIDCNFIVNAVHYLTPHELAIQIAAGRYIEFQGEQHYFESLLLFLNREPEGLLKLENALAKFLGKGWGEEVES